MAERPPSRPSVAGEERKEDGVVALNICNLEPHTRPVHEEVPPAPGLELPREEAEALEHVRSFLNSRGKQQDEAKKLEFLASLCALCPASRFAARPSLPVRRELWRCKSDLAGLLEVLLQEEPSDRLGTAVRQQVLLAISAMSKGRLLVESNWESLLQACCCSVFSLPPLEQLQGLDAVLYSKTLDAMDSLLQVLALHSPASSLLDVQIILQVLLPFAESQQAAVRERAVGRLVRLSDLLISSSLLPTRRCFAGSSSSCDSSFLEQSLPVLGQLVGHLTLCCAYKDERSRDNAAEALRHLCEFLLREESRELPRDSPQHQELLKDQEAVNTFKLSESKDMREMSRIFGKYLEPDERAEVILAAIRGMRDCSSYNTQAAAHMLDAFVPGDASLLENVSKMVRDIWLNIVSIRDASARLSLNRALLLSSTFPDVVVTCLLHCSPSCDSAAAAIWKVLVSTPGAAERMLWELLSVLEDWPLPERESSAVSSLAASRALQEILRQPPCLQVLEPIFPQLFLALLFHSSFTAALQPEESALLWQEYQGEETPRSSPVRLAVQTMKALLCHAGHESLVLTMARKGGWAMLQSAETQHQGVSLLAREMRKSPRALRVFLFERLVVLLLNEEGSREVPALAFLVELLACSDLHGDEDDFLDIFSRRLRSRCRVLRELVLRGLVLLCERQEMIGKIQFLVPLLMMRLQEEDRDISSKALVVLSHLVPVLERVRLTHRALPLAEMLLPLFEDESDHTRKLSMHLFSKVMEVAADPKNEQMKMQVQRSLLPLLFHLEDESPSVVQAAQEALLRAAKFLKWKELRHLLKSQQPWKIGECLLAGERGRRGAEQYLRQSLSYLESTQEALCEAAVRFLGLTGRCIKAQSKEKVENICEALQGLQHKDSSLTISSLATQTMLILRAPGKETPSQDSLRNRVRRVWERWRRPLQGSSICCWRSDGR